MPSLKPPRYSSNRTKGAIRQSPEGLDRKGSSLCVLSCGANATNDLLQQLDIPGSCRECRTRPSSRRYTTCRARSCWVIDASMAKRA